jgi:Family of unknown function (DUF6338)
VPETVQALAIAVVAVLPGALGVWGYERRVGKWSIGSPDRVIRFVATSAVFHAALAPLTYWLCRHYLHSGRLNRHDTLPAYLWLALLLYLAIPYAVGRMVGRAMTGDLRIEWLRGSNPAPRSWDLFFATKPNGWMRIRLKSGRWIGGAYAPGSHASGYPEAPDLYLVATAEMDQESGDFLTNGTGGPVLREGTLFVNGAEFEYFEFVQA